MVETPKIDVSGQFSGSTYNVGSRFRAREQPRVGRALPNAFLSLIQTGLDISQTNKEIKDNSPAEREYWIKQERLINETFAMNGSNNKTDPVAFKAQAAKDKEKLMRSVPDDKKEKFSLLYEHQMNGFNQAVSENRIKLDYDRQLETFITESDNLRAQAMNATLNNDPEGYAEAAKKWAENEEYMYKNGFISIEKKVSRLKDFTDGAIIQQNLGHAKQLFGNSEQLSTFLQSVDKTETYTPEQKKSIKNNILSEYSTWQALNEVAAQKTSENADFGIKAYSMGLTPAGFDYDATMEELKAYGQTEKAAALAEARNTLEEMTGFAKLSIPQMEEEIQTLKKGANTEYDLNKLKLLENLRAEAQKDIEADPMAYAISHNVINDGGMDMTNPQSIQQRRQNAAILKEKYNLDYAPIITKTEAKNLSNILKNADTETKTVIIGNLNSQFGEDAGQIFQQISSNNPELAVAAKVYSRNPDIAKNIIAGIEISENEKQFVPSNDMALNNTFGKVDQVLANMTSEDIAKVKTAIKANMAFKNKKNNIFTNGDATNDSRLEYAEEAITEVLGGKIATQSGSWWSGYSYILLPENVSEDNFDDWKNSLTDKDIGNVYLGDKKVSAKRIKEDGVLAYDDDRKYTVTLNGQYLRRADGEIFILEYRGK